MNIHLVFPYIKYFNLRNPRQQYLKRGTIPAENIKFLKTHVFLKTHSSQDIFMKILYLKEYKISMKKKRK